MLRQSSKGRTPTENLWPSRLGESNCWANHSSDVFSMVTETEAAASDTSLDVPKGTEGGNITKYGSYERRRLMKPQEGRMFLSSKLSTRIGTWNVRTMYQTGKCAQVIREMSRLKLDVLGIAECRWNGAGEVKMGTGELVLYSGMQEEDAIHEKGVAIILSSRVKDCLIEWEPVSERILVIRLKSRFQNVSIIQTYAPTDPTEYGLKEDFYNKLQEVINKISRRDLVMVMGDMNAKVGNDNRNRELIMGKHGLPAEISENGELFLEFCSTNDLVIGGTMFPHKRVHKVTWMSNDGVTENQIDHITINRRFRKSLQDTRVMRSADVGSDHQLILAKVKIKLTRVVKPKSSRTKYCVEKLKDLQIKEEFQLKLANRFDVLYNGSDQEEDDDLDQEWENIKQMYVSTCEEVLGKPKVERKEWMSEATWKLVEERKNLKLCIGNTKTRNQKKQAMVKHQEKDKEVKKSCRRDKATHMENLSTEAESAAGSGDIKKLYNIVKQLSGSTKKGSRPIRNKDGVMLGKLDDQLQRWKEHFEEILNRPRPAATPILGEPESELRIRTDCITKSEIRKALKSMKNGKAAGIDNIPPEALSAGGEITVEVLWRFLKKIWDAEEVPKEWKKGILVKLPKKGDLSDCGNWRGIMLLVIASKILSRVILERMKTAVEEKLREEQAGFRAERSCGDQIATLRIIIEQSLEWNTGLYMTFIDFEKAFDSVDRETMWKLLRVYGVPNKIVNMIKLTYDGFKAGVLHEGVISDEFEMKTGVKQGCLLSPLLFLVVLDWVTREAFAEGKTGVRWTLCSHLEDLEFADDLCLVSQRVEHMRKKLSQLEEKAGKVGLKISIKKTKEMRVRTPANTGPIRCGANTIERVDKFQYLGSIVTATGGTEEDIETRMRKAQQVFALLKKVWRARTIALKTKLRIFNACVMSVLLYGCETWRSSKTLMARLQSFVNRKLRYIIGIWWPRKIKNEDLWARTNQEEIEITIRKRKFKWIGHTLRKPQTSVTRQALEWNPQGARRRGRPRGSWRRTVMDELAEQNISWNEAKLLARNRVRWRAAVDALCSKKPDEED